ncbi:MAG: ABC transporter transmembrane domain-containing protein [Planctomycetota bacterium]|jgi:putative ABC transport system ATP-binding protein
MLQPSSDQPSGPQILQRELLREMLADLLLRLDVPHELSSVSQALSDSLIDGARTPDALAMSIMRAGTAVGLRIAPLELSMVDIWELLLDEFPVAVLYQSASGEQKAAVFSNVAGGRVDATVISSKSKRSDSLTRRDLSRLLGQGKSHQYFIAEPSLSCEKITSSHEPDQARIPKVHDDHDSHHHGEHISPQKRLLRLLRLDSKDIWTLGVFTLVVSFLDLATPLAVEQMVTTIGFASVVQPLIWIALMLFAILTLSAVIKALQVFVVEILQRRMVVRIVGDLAERLPRLERSAMDGIHGPELANRFFDVMTMQKATASLLLDLLALAIQTCAGLLLLAVYSPYLLAFDLILLMAMTVMIYALGRGGVRTAIEESLIKYRIAHWLQDIIGNPNAFQVHGGGSLAVDRANRLVVEYLSARRKHFAVLIRQSLFALLLYAVSISALLSLGGWLVLNNALTIGQLVASVSVVAVVVGAFSKVGKSLESFYDLMAATDKVGHLIDLPTVPPSRPLDAGIGPVDVRFRDLVLHTGREHISIPNFSIQTGQKVALHCEGHSGKTMLLQTIAGLRNPHSGLCEIGGIDSRDVNRFADGSMVGIASEVEIFHGTLQENITLNRLSIHDSDLREALQLAGLWDEVLSLPMGLDTMLQTNGFPLSRSQAHRLMIARAIVSRPRLLLIDASLDKLGPRMRERVWNNLRSDLQPWTMLVVTHDTKIINDCDKRIELIPPANANH